MRGLDNLIGKVERFFIEYFCYLNAKNVLWAYNHNCKQYFGINLSEEVIYNAQSTVSLWKDN